ncbi:hypothetical protein [Halorarius halobius]|uniref:hypothetical protein n=1 Tax=Halorarius halobius TaxID=2962671 RepID=UPI0020CC9B76|nr:hypothetical protein [Halorarius halobius]
MRRPPHDTSTTSGRSDRPADRRASRDGAPLGIKILAVLNVIGALLALIPIGMLFGVSHPLGPIAGVLLLGFVAAGLVFTYGLVTMQYWGWLGTVVFNGLGLVLDLAMGDLLGLLVGGGILLYLLSKGDLYA